MSVGESIDPDSAQGIVTEASVSAWLRNGTAVTDTPIVIPSPPAPSLEQCVFDGAKPAARFQLALGRLRSRAKTDELFGVLRSLYVEAVREREGDHLLAEHVLGTYRLNADVDVPYQKAAHRVIGDRTAYETLRRALDGIVDTETAQHLFPDAVGAPVLTLRAYDHLLMTALLRGYKNGAMLADALGTDRATVSHACTAKISTPYAETPHPRIVALARTRQQLHTTELLTFLSGLYVRAVEARATSPTEAEWTLDHPNHFIAEVRRTHGLGNVRGKTAAERLLRDALETLFDERTAARLFPVAADAKLQTYAGFRHSVVNALHADLTPAQLAMQLSTEQATINQLLRPPDSLYSVHDTERDLATLRTQYDPHKLLHVFRVLYVTAVKQRVEKIDPQAPYRVFLHPRKVIDALLRDSAVVQKKPSGTTVEIALRQALAPFVDRDTLDVLMPMRQDAPLLTYLGFQRTLLEALQVKIGTRKAMTNELGTHWGHINEILEDDAVKKTRDRYAAQPKRFFTLSEFTAMYTVHAVRTHSHYSDSYIFQKVLNSGGEDMNRRMRIGETLLADLEQTTPFPVWLRSVFVDPAPLAQVTLTSRQAREAYIETVHLLCGRNPRESAYALGMWPRTFRKMHAKIAQERASPLPA